LKSGRGRGRDGFVLNGGNAAVQRSTSEANGDLRLHPYSPCLDRREPSDTPSGLDILGFPRFLDGDLGGVQRIDMRAHEHDKVLALLFGEARPGGTRTLATFTLPPIHTILLAIGAGPTPELPLAPNGVFFPNPCGAFVLRWPDVQPYAGTTRKSTPETAMRAEGSSARSWKRRA
jgi:hypothetical protein